MRLPDRHLNNLASTDSGGSMSDGNVAPERAFDGKRRTVHQVVSDAF